MHSRGVRGGAGPGYQPYQRTDDPLRAAKARVQAAYQAQSLALTQLATRSGFGASKELLAAEAELAAALAAQKALQGVGGAGALADYSALVGEAERGMEALRLGGLGDRAIGQFDRAISAYSDFDASPAVPAPRSGARNSSYVDYKLRDAMEGDLEDAREELEELRAEGGDWEEERYLQNRINQLEDDIDAVNEGRNPYEERYTLTDDEVAEYARLDRVDRRRAAELDAQIAAEQAKQVAAKAAQAAAAAMSSRAAYPGGGAGAGAGASAHRAAPRVVSTHVVHRPAPPRPMPAHRAPPPHAPRAAPSWLAASNAGKAVGY